MVARRFRPSTRWVGLFAGLAIVLSACTPAAPTPAPASKPATAPTTAAAPAKPATAPTTAAKPAAAPTTAAAPTAATPAGSPKPSGTAAAVTGPVAGAPKELRVGIVTILSGPAAGPFGIPARNASEVWIDYINSHGGVGGVKITPIVIDETGNTDQIVTAYRRLVSEQNVDLVIGYISSANCLAVGPVAEELKVLTIIFDCGTVRLLEESAQPHYLFRTAAHTAADDIGAARYLLERKPDVKTVAGINQDYAWGHDSWDIFSKALKKLKPDVQFTDQLFPKLFQGQFNTEISRLSASKPDVIFNSLWGGDFLAFVNQGKARGIFNQSLNIFNNDGVSLQELGNTMPDGAIIGMRGPHWIDVPDPKTNPLQKAFIDGYKAKFNNQYPMPHGSYHIAQALSGVKAAYEKAIQAAGRWPDKEQVVKAFEHLEFDSPSGPISMALSNGHQAIEPSVFGTTRFDAQLGFDRLENLKEFPAACVNPPNGVKTDDWISQGFPGAKC